MSNSHALNFSWCGSQRYRKFPTRTLAIATVITILQFMHAGRSVYYAAILQAGGCIKH